MASVLNIAHKLDSIDQDARKEAFHAVSHYLDQHDPYLDTNTNRRLRQILQEKGEEADSLVRRLKPSISKSLTSFLEGLNIEEKEVLEAICFYKQVSILQKHPLDYIIDICAGNCLTGATWLVESAVRNVYFVDIRESRDSRKVRDQLRKGKYNFSYSVMDITSEANMETFMESIEGQNGLITAMHACGALTDRVLLLAAKYSLHVAVVPCCHNKDTKGLSILSIDATARLSPYFSPREYTDLFRVLYMVQQGYRIEVRALPREVTDKNRIIIGFPVK